MRVLSSKLSDTNRIQLNEKGYFIMHSEHQTLALESSCPHRGGPLQYGEQIENSSLIVCPWHENKLKVCNLKRQSLCVVRIMDELNFLVPDKAQVMVWKETPRRSHSEESRNE
jgi:nitrite reductase (NADH) small subunit